MKQPHDCQPGQPVELIDFSGQSARLNGERAYLHSPQPDEYGLFTAHILVRPATQHQDALTRPVKGAEARFRVLEAEQPPKDFHWFFTAKRYRYAIQPSGEQPQQIA